MMKEFIKYFVVILLCIFPSAVNAQEDDAEKVTISAKMYNKFLSEIKALKDSTKSLADSCVLLNSRIQDLSSQNAELSSAVMANKTNMASKGIAISNKDGIINSLKKQHQTDSLSVVDCQSGLAKMQAKVDEITARYANGRLYFKYDAGRIKECIDEYNNIGTISVKEKFKQLPNLLRNYGNFARQLKTLLEAAQNDPDRKVRNKAEEYRAKYSKEIRGSLYFTNYYAKKDSGTWSIPYLNNIVKVALSILQKHDPGHNDPVNFSSLIEML